MNIQQVINHVIEKKDLDRQTMHDVFSMIFSGDVTDAQIAGLLVALRMKGETVDEITAAAECMREFSAQVEVSVSPLVDIVGTGGDGLKTLNVSTASSIVLAAAGGYVAKHGNRAASSKSGSADVLEAAGANINLNADEVSECIETVGLGFMFAPAHHGAMKYAIGPRKELATRTLFNILGPLTNPASAKRMVLGVFNKALCMPMAKVLQQLNCEHALVVHGHDGMDEISICDKTHVVELKSNEINEFTFNPEDNGIALSQIDELIVNDANDSLTKINDAFMGKSSAAKDIIAVNSGAAIYVAGLASNIAEGIEKAKAILDNGKAAEKLAQYVKHTQTFK